MTIPVKTECPLCKIWSTSQAPKVAGRITCIGLLLALLLDAIAESDSAYVFLGYERVLCAIAVSTSTTLCSGMFLELWHGPCSIHRSLWIVPTEEVGIDPTAVLIDSSSQVGLPSTVKAFGNGPQSRLRDEDEQTEMRYENMNPRP